jgi:D-alanyl-D-alanine carboxypeptidase (penicillin-binding protein 5/6)
VRKQLSLTILSLVIFLLSLSLFVWMKFFYPQAVRIVHEVALLPLTDLPIAKRGSSLADELNLTARSALALDLQTMTVLYASKERQSLAPASTVKMMTALVAMELYPLDQPIVANLQEPVLGTKLPLLNGQSFRAADLISAMMIASSNDAAYVLAKESPLGLEAFINRMNERASELGLRQTYFVNSAGLDGDSQLSSAFDLSLIARELLLSPFLKDLVAKSSMQITDTTGMVQHQLYNTNQLMGYVQGVKGVKTGTTERAGEVLVTLIERDGHQILLTLMGSQDRYADTMKLLNWVLNNYEWQNIDGFAAANLL